MAVVDKIQLPDGSQFDVKDNISQYASQGYVDSAVAGITKASIGLGNVDNTSDANKPISTATQAALDKIGEVNDFTVSTTWEANADIGDYSTYPYKQVISTNKFAQAGTTGYCAPNHELMGGTPDSWITSSEETDIYNIASQIDISTTGITLIVKEPTTNALTLRIWGLGQIKES